MSSLFSNIEAAATWSAQAMAMVRVKMHQRNVQKSLKCRSAELEFCYAKLTKVSRSFAAVIMALNDEVRDAVCIFYLVLRGLDTVEDDMSIPLDTKCPEVANFYQRLDEPGWNIKGIGKADEKELLERFDLVISAYQALPEYLQDPIKEITKSMGAGMVEFLLKEDHVQTCEEYDRYCHYVAGLVGHGLSKLFAGSGLEDATLATELDLANKMGLFLQKVNITRDYLEDIVEEPPRMFWPKEIWGLYTEDFHSFTKPENREVALQCLNHMVLNALDLIPSCLEYLDRLTDPSVLEFCAIPQVMAIATLNALYNNPKVFTGVVKISKGLACELILGCNSMLNVRLTFQRFMNSLLNKSHGVDGSAEMRERLRVLIAENDKEIAREQSQAATSTSLSSMILLYCRGLTASAISVIKGMIWPAAIQS